MILFIHRSALVKEFWKWLTQRKVFGGFISWSYINLHAISYRTAVYKKKYLKLALHRGYLSLHRLIIIEQEQQGCKDEIKHICTDTLRKEFQKLFH